MAAPVRSETIDEARARKMPGSIALHQRAKAVFPDGVTRPAVIALQHPQPGKRGTLGSNTVIGLGSWRFDANLGKSFRISESKSLQVRFDAQNVLNHPQPANPNLAITGTAPFGQIATTTGFFGTTYGNDRT